MAGLNWLEALVQDVRYAWRGMLRSPGSMAVAVIAVALGVGGATAVFSVVDRILFRPLPYANQDRIAWFGMKAPINQNEFLLEGDFLHFRDHQQVFESMTAMSRAGECDLNETEPMRLLCAQFSSSFLPTLGMLPLLGRNFLPEEDLRGSDRAALLTYGFWQRRYGGDPGVLGRRILIYGSPAQIVGVLPRDFELPNLAPVDVILSQQLNLKPGVASTFLTTFGRLKPGVSIAQARQALHPLYLDVLRNVPAGFSKEVTFHVTSLRDRQVRDYRTASLVLLGCVIALLLIACANVANLLLARAAARQREFAVRTAIGATRWRLIRLALTESLLLGVIGGVAGTGVAAVMLRAIVGIAPEGIVRLREASLDLRVLGFTLAVSMASGILFGLAPAIQRTGSEVLNSARTMGRGWRLSHAMIAVQIGLSCVLLSGAALLVQSLRNLQQIQLGISTEHVLTVRVQLGQQRYGTPQKQSEFFENALQRLSNLPGASRVAMSDSVPLSGPALSMIYSNIEIEGRPPLDPKRQTGGMTVARTVTPAYFHALGIPIVRGRGFTEQDRTSGEGYAILDERLARRLFAGGDAIGQRMRSGLSGQFRTIVGIAKPVKNAALGENDEPEYYYLWRRTPDSGRIAGYFTIRSDAESAELSSLVRAQFLQLDPTLPVTINSLTDTISRQTERPKFRTMMLTVFAAIGVVLAAVGQFGLISYLVTQRSAEIGLRMALGATANNVVGLVLRRTLFWTAAGALAGIATAFWLSRNLEPLLFGVGPRDLTSFAAVLALLFAVSMVAAFQPSMRAVRIDPARALRHE